MNPLRTFDRFQRDRTWLAVPTAVVRRFGDDGAGGLAAMIAYYAFFSIFPLLMVLTSVTELVVRDRPDLQERLLSSALAQFPVVGTQLRNEVGSIQGSGVALVVGIVLAVWAGLGGIRSAQVAMDTVWDVPRRRRRGALASIGMALVMLVVLGTFVVAGAILASLPSAGAGLLGSIAGLAGSVLINVVLFATAFRLLTAATLSWRGVLPGACAGGVGWTALLAAGGWIVAGRVASSSDVYGAFAVVIGLLAWIYLGTQLTLYAAELNVVLDQRLWPRSLEGGLTDADRRALSRSAKREERTEGQRVTVRFDDRPPD